MARGRHSEHPIICFNCGEPLVGCEGLYGTWMHERNRTERCAGSTVLACPETVEQMESRLSRTRKEYRERNHPRSSSHR